MLALVALLTLFATACGSSNSGFPKSSGEYPIQPNSLSYDGKKYALLWSDTAGNLHKAEGEDVRMQQDERTFLEVGDGSPVVHLKQDEGVTVRGKDRDGPFETFWFPFFLGQALGGGGPIINQPYPGDRGVGRGASYQYPPTDTFGRDDSLHGSVQRSKAETPDYTKVQPAPYAVSGQNSGAGDGTAASNKAVTPNSGQAGGTGAGSAASNKGTFQSSGGTGVNAGSGLSSDSKKTGTGGSVTTRPKSPPIKAPALPRRR
jgi:hypothetical protein